MELIAKKNLLSEFEVEASFYNVKIGTEAFECRSHAKIKRIGFNSDRLDAVLVLCNPGSCHPENRDNIPTIDPRREDAPFVKSNSDETQHQVMRLMLIKQWNQVNIINISDLCAGNLKSFKESLEKAEKFSFHYHSIFSEERNSKLEEVFDFNTGPVIIGWGTNSVIKSMANDVLQNKHISQGVGWEYAISPYYYHPGPRLAEKKKEWLTILNQQII